MGSKELEIITNRFAHNFQFLNVEDVEPSDVAQMFLNHYHGEAPDDWIKLADTWAERLAALPRKERAKVLIRHKRLQRLNDQQRQFIKDDIEVYRSWENDPTPIGEVMRKRIRDKLLKSGVEV